MGIIAISFGVACAVVLVTAALCRSRDATVSALVLAALWALTKILPLGRDTAPGVMADAAAKTIIALVGLWIMHRRPKLLSPRILVSSQLVASLCVVLWAFSRNMGFAHPLYPYAVAMNLLYLIALMSVLSLGLHDGAVCFRSWLSGHRHVGAWSSPGARWGREAAIPRRRR